jgi:hypothetical protein
MTTQRMLVLFALLILCCPVVFGGDEILKGFFIYHINNVDVHGELLFRMDSLSSQTLTSKIMTYNFDTKKLSTILHPPKPGQLIVTQDGKWVAVLMSGDVCDLSNSKMIILSRQTGELRTITCHGAINYAQIVGDYIFMQKNRCQRIDFYDPFKNEIIPFGLPADLLGQKGEYTVVGARMGEPDDCLFVYRSIYMENGILKE